MPLNALTLTRQSLYELAWSKPISELAKDFAISDVALAKRCRAVDVPIPYRGYWARKAAGQDPPKLPLPKYRTRTPSEKLAPNPSTLPQAILRDGEEPPVPFSIPATRPDDLPPIPKPAEDLAWRAERDAFERDPRNAVIVELKPRRWHPVIAAFVSRYREDVAQLLASKRAHEQYEKWPAHRKARESNPSGWQWHWAERNGHLLPFRHHATPFRLSPGTFERALAIANSLCLAADARGFAVTQAADQGRLHIQGHGGSVNFRMSERTEKKQRMTARYGGKPEREEYREPTGVLTLFLEVGYFTGPQFRDLPKHPLESRLNEVFLAINRTVINCRRESRIDAENRRLEAERLALRAIVEQRRQAELKRQADETRRRAELLSESEQWQRATLLRKYVEHIQQRLAQSGQGDSGPPQDWTRWSLDVATNLDPTTDRVRALSPN